MCQGMHHNVPSGASGPAREINKKEKSMENTIENNFTYHPPKDDQAERYMMIRKEAKEFAKLISELCPESRERSIAITNLEQSVMWANASIARNE